MVVPALGMADNDEARFGIGQHLGGDVAGMRAGRVGMAVLAADGDASPLGARGESRDQEKRRADQDIDTARQVRPHRR